MSEKSLIAATKQGNYDIVYTLCKNGVNVNYLRGEPLFQSISNNNYEIMELLIGWGADIHIYNRGGVDVLDIIIQKDTEIFELNQNINKASYADQYDINKTLYEQHPLVQYLSNKIGGQLQGNALMDYVEYLSNNYIGDINASMIQNAYRGRMERKKSKKRRKNIHHILNRNGREFQNPAHAVLSQPGLMDEITNQLPDNWGVATRRPTKIVSSATNGWSY